MTVVVLKERETPAIAIVLNVLRAVPAGIEVLVSRDRKCKIEPRIYRGCRGGGEAQKEMGRAAGGGKGPGSNVRKSTQYAVLSSL